MDLLFIGGVLHLDRNGQIALALVVLCHDTDLCPVAAFVDVDAAAVPAVHVDLIQQPIQQLVQPGILVVIACRDGKDDVLFRRDQALEVDVACKQVIAQTDLDVVVQVLCGDLTQCLVVV